MNLLMNFAKRYFTGKEDDLTFYQANGFTPALPRTGTGLYIHIPFCTHFCPYCPYNKIMYDSDTANLYKTALIREAENYFNLFGKIDFDTLYIGGGTPTLLIDQLEDVINAINRFFNITGSRAIETNPNNIDQHVAAKLKSLGFNLISIGIQSFNEALLKKIGRNNDEKISRQALEQVIAAGFETVNADLIFAIRDQTLNDIRYDLKLLIESGVDQITCYPLFTFPYSEIAELRNLKKVELPGFYRRREMYYFIHEYLEEHGFKRTSVWSFNKGGGKQFSSVTRDYYLGLGAGAGSYNGGDFYFNTFSVPDFIKSVSGRFPVSIRMKLSPELERSLWLYWRLYETEIPKKKYGSLFDRPFDKDYRYFLTFLRIMGMVEWEDDTGLKLTMSGIHYIHILQNYLALNGVNKIWRVSKLIPWPEKIKLY